MHFSTQVLADTIRTGADMRLQFPKALLLASLFFLPGALWAGDDIPKAAWKRPIGLPLANPGVTKANQQWMILDDYWQGAPVGGFGAGTFSRTFRGDFARWHLRAGVHKYQPVISNAFAMYQKSEGAAQGVAQVLTAAHTGGGLLGAWTWDYPVGAGDYYALYPKSWFDYRWEKFPAHVWVEQFSPILPNNYKETSYPVAVYRWHAENPTDKAVTVSVMFSWTNMVGWFRDEVPMFTFRRNQGNINRFASESVGAAGTMKGIVFDRVRQMPVQDDFDGQMAIATLESPGVEVTYQTSFYPTLAGREEWEPFSRDGKLPNDNRNWLSIREDVAGAIAITFTLKPGEKRVVPIVLTWDFPIVQFGEGRKWYRHYTNFYGTSGQNAWKIAKDGLLNADAWSDAIDRWQAPYINDESKPLWYRSMLFNELYIVADGGSFWGRPVGSPEGSPEVFSFLESADYTYYSSLDVLFYGSLPVAKFWPNLDKDLLRRFADTVPQEQPENVIWLWKIFRSGGMHTREQKKRGIVAHDLGSVGGDPFFQVNDFVWQDTNDWKDLNSNFVLMVWRDYVLNGNKDTEFLRYTWPAVQEAMKYLRQYDRNGDGLPENDGVPDQTYDGWIVQGESAYCGSLYLAALRAAEEVGHKLGHPQEAASYHELFLKAQKSYIEKLWTGEYFRYDTQSEYKDSIQAMQLAGQWYATMTGLGDLVPKEMQRAALKKVFDFNVMKFGNGELGAVNGMRPDGQVVHTTEQIQEVWVGTTFALAAMLLQDGMKEEAYKTAWGVYDVSYNKKGYWFRTPEYWDSEMRYRAQMNMRPAAVWAMEMLAPPSTAKYVSSR